MAENETQESWEQIQAFIEAKNAEALDEYLDMLSPAQVARAISHLDDAAQVGLLTLLKPDDAADLLEELSDVQGADILEKLSAASAAAILDVTESDHRVDVLGEMDSTDAEAILGSMTRDQADDARRLLRYSEDTAGGIMITEFLAYPSSWRVAGVLSDLRKNAEQYADYSVQYVYVESDTRVLVGVVPLRDLVLARDEVSLAKIMIANPIYVTADASLEEIEQLFDRFGFIGLPVTDKKGRLIGVVRRSDAEEAVSERTEKTFMRFSGIVLGDELRDMSFATRSLGRLCWLVLNMFLNVIAAIVIIFYEATIETVVALAVVLPVICNMSGCSGNQAIAVSIRELTLGVIDPRDVVRVALKEIQTGVFNGVILGLLLGTVTYLWKGNPYLGIVVGGALALNTLWAVILGGSVPLVLRRFKVDPAIAAAPILTTIIDMCGFFLVLSFAAYAVNKGVL